MRYEARETGLDLGSMGVDAIANTMAAAVQKALKDTRVTSAAQNLAAPLVSQATGELKTAVLLVGVGGFLGGALTGYLLAKVLR